MNKYILYLCILAVLSTPSLAGFQVLNQKGNFGSVYNLTISDTVLTENTTVILNYTFAPVFNQSGSDHINVGLFQDPHDLVTILGGFTSTWDESNGTANGTNQDYMFWNAVSPRFAFTVPSGSYFFEINITDTVISYATNDVVVSMNKTMTTKVPVTVMNTLLPNPSNTSSAIPSASTKPNGATRGSSIPTVTIATVLIVMCAVLVLA